MIVIALKSHIGVLFVTVRRPTVCSVLVMFVCILINNHNKEKNRYY